MMTERSIKDNPPEPTEGLLRRRHGSTFGKRMPADLAERQGRITRMAWAALGREDALLFLNGHNEALGGRPLDLATDSAEGFAIVERALVDSSAG